MNWIEVLMRGYCIFVALALGLVFLIDLYDEKARMKR